MGIVYGQNIKKIFVVSPNDITTGGIELLHQLADRLSNLGLDALIYYTTGKNEISPAYKKYNIKISNVLEDDEHSLIVFPEIYVERAILIKRAKVLIWWLSVDNFIKDSYNILKLSEYLKWRPFFAFKFLVKRIVFTLSGEKIFKFKTYSTSDIAKFNFVHAYQSEFANQFLQKHGFKNLYRLSDFINKEFIPKGIESENRVPQVLYNPLKGYKFTKQIIGLLPEIRWKPLVNMTRKEVIDAVRSSMLYIDFGDHPGKDRFPREAAINGCCVITGRSGSANYYDDVPIPDYYKIQQTGSNLNLIRERILDILANYQKHIKEFEYYRARILVEEKEFYEDIDKIFTSQ